MGGKGKNEKGKLCYVKIGLHKLTSSIKGTESAGAGATVMKCYEGHCEACLLRTLSMSLTGVGVSG